MDKTLSNPSFEEAESPTTETTAARAEGGDADAQFSLGLRFANEGTDQDYTQAAHWYLQAAEQSHAIAQFNLGVMYSRGQGVQRDEARSMMWLQKAAHLGDSGAQYTLGMRQNRVSMDEGPEAANESMIEAYKWLRLSAAQGYRDSATGCDFVSLGMTRAGVIESNRRVAAFVAGAENRDPAS